MSRVALRERLPGIAAVCLVAACSGSPESVHPAHVLAVRATDYAFIAPDTVEAGFTAVRLENQGSELHHLQLLRIGEGHTFAELNDSVAAGDPRPAWATPVGGPNVPGEKGSEISLQLTEGAYALICYMPSPKDGKSHFTKGMIRQLAVVPASGSNGGEPKVDSRIVMKDYSYTISTALHAGRQTVRVENAGTQPHEAILFRLGEGKTPAEFLEWTGRLDVSPARRAERRHHLNCGGRVQRDDPGPRGGRVSPAVLRSGRERSPPPCGARHDPAIESGVTG